jgi:hypothetical protein
MRCVGSPSRGGKGPGPAPGAPQPPAIPSAPGGGTTPLPSLGPSPRHSRSVTLPSVPEVSSAIPPAKQHQTPRFFPQNRLARLTPARAPPSESTPPAAPAAAPPRPRRPARPSNWPAQPSHQTLRGMVISEPPPIPTPCTGRWLVCLGFSFSQTGRSSKRSSPRSLALITKIHPPFFSIFLSRLGRLGARASRSAAGGARARREAVAAKRALAARLPPPPQKRRLLRSPCPC